MGYSNPLLSVVMRMYNERTTIDEIIRRVLAVTFRMDVRASARRASVDDLEVSFY